MFRPAFLIFSIISMLAISATLELLKKNQAEISFVYAIY
jgi:hypothetical protein